MINNNENSTELEELTDEQLEKAQGGASLWNGKVEFPRTHSDRSRVKEIQKLSVDSQIVKSGGGSSI